MRPQSPAELKFKTPLAKLWLSAFRDPSYTLIFLGFFSCGYQIGFITAHFPAFVTEMCGPIATDGVLHAMGVTTTSALGAVAISLIGIGEHRWHIGSRLGRQALFEKVPSRGDLHRPDASCGDLHNVADHAGISGDIFGRDGGVMACNDTADLGACGLHLRAAVHGDPVRDRIF